MDPFGTGQIVLTVQMGETEQVVLTVQMGETDIRCGISKIETTKPN